MSGREASKPTIRLHECPCGEPLVEGTYHGHRGIFDRMNDIVVCPVTLMCLNGHTRELWMQHDEAMEAMASVIQVGR